ncbi:MAG: 6-bladed beta-propeller [Balneolia bacterium]|nr:6-bladed beta-propeller [Balneolia bacterium]
MLFRLASYLLFFIIIGCSKEQVSHNEVTLVLEKVDVLTIEPKNPLTLGRIMGITPVAPDQSRFLVKNHNNSIVNVFARDGEHLYQFGEPGRGPEELERIFMSGFDDELNVLIWDAGQDLLKFFDSNGDFIQADEAFISRGIWSREHLLHFTESGWILPMETPGAQLWDDRESVALFNEDFSEQTTAGGWDPFYKESSTILQHPLLTFDRETNYIWVVHRTSPSIRILDTSFNKVQRLSHASSNFSRADQDILMEFGIQERQQALSNISLVMQPYLTDDYFIFYFVNQTEEVFQTLDSDDAGIFAAVYDKHSFDYVGEITLPGMLTGVIDSKLMVLLNDDPDDFTIGLYEIDVNDTLQ